ncbi:MAG: isochorismatase family protein [Methylophilaceae bacterium]
MKHSLIAKRHQSQLVIIDVQEKLAAAMSADAIAAVTRNCSILLQAAALLQIPSLYTEQYPQGLGGTLPELLPFLASKSRVEKITFSCCDELKFNRQLANDRPQVILAGLESHICILQTALQLQALGRQVFVVEDAVLSRSAENKANALSRLRHAGVIVSNTESVVFEWLGAAEGQAFKQISQLVR